LNIAQARYDFDDPRMAGFLALVDHVNAAADRFPGFVWRLEDESGSLNAGRSAREIVNLSVWRSVADLRAFTFSGVHKRAIIKREKWFDSLSEPYLVIWPVTLDHRPTREEGFERLERLRRLGPSEHVLGWKEALAEGAADEYTARAVQLSE
jgi:heme-degrading monooxygenase HmoA